jgi:hypothetical protein
MVSIVPDPAAPASAQVLSQIMYAMYSSDRVVAQRCACALAHMASIPDLAAAFVERKGLDILVDMLTDSKSRDTRDALQREAASASPRTSLLSSRRAPCFAFGKPLLPNTFMIGCLASTGPPQSCTAEQQ